jgi:hypothetical protein
VDACADGNTERNENTNKANHAEGNTTRVDANLPQSGYESVNGKNLAKCTSMGLRPKDIIIKARRTRVIRATPA